jgi:hypothetical protein
MCESLDAIEVTMADRAPSIPPDTLVITLAVRAW